MKCPYMGCQFFTRPLLFWLFFLFFLSFSFLVWTIRIAMSLFSASKAEPLFHGFCPFFDCHGIYVHGFWIFLLEVPPFLRFFLLRNSSGFCCGPAQHSLRFLVSIIDS